MAILIHDYKHMLAGAFHGMRRGFVYLYSSIINTFRADSFMYYFLFWMPKVNMTHEQYIHCLKQEEHND